MKAVLLIHSGNINCGIGGAERYIRDQMDIYLKNQIICFTLFPIRKNLLWMKSDYYGLMKGFQFIGVFSTREIIGYFRYLKSSGIEIVQLMIHHLLNVNLKTVSRIINSLKIKYSRIYIHDYYTACLQYNLMKNDSEFCGSAVLEVKKCEGCRYYQQSCKHKEDMKWFFQSLKCKETEFAVPSDLVRTLWSQAYPEYVENIRVIPHLRFAGEYYFDRSPVKGRQKMKAAFIGNQLYGKGWDKWVKATDRLLAKQSALELYYLGSKKDKRKGIKNIEVSIVKSGKNAMIHSLRENHIDVAVLFSGCPETYSYTYYEASAAGCFIITNIDSGNIACQVKKNGNGIIVKNTAQDLYNFLNDSKSLAVQINKYRQSDYKAPQKLISNITLDELLINNNIEEKTGFVKLQDVKCKRRNIKIQFTELLYRIKYHKYLNRVSKHEV